MTRWQLQPIFDSYAIVGVVALVLLALLAVRPGFARLDRRKQIILLVLRASVILLLIVAMLNPTRISTEDKPQTSLVLLLLDESRSMQFPDATGQQSRWEAIRKLMQQNQSQLSEMGEPIEMRAFTFADSLQEAPLNGGAIELPPSPAGRATDIGASLRDAVRRELGRRIAAVFLATDGVQTAYNPEVDLYDAPRELSRLGTPLYGLAFGPEGDLSQGRDVAVENLPEQYTVFVKNELIVRGVVRSRGYEGREIPLELVVEDARGQSTVVGRRTVIGGAELTQSSVEMLFSPQEPGQYRLTLRAAEQPGELVVKNNELTAFVNVLDGGLRVAYLYGDRLGEQRVLRWSLESSPDVEVDPLFIDRRQRSNWPLDRREFLGDPKYDVFIVENLDANALTKETWEALAEQIGAGKGLIMIGGYSSFGAGGYQETPLAKVLPIEMGRLERQSVDIRTPISPDLHLEAADGIAMLPTQPHPILLLGPEAENDSLWRSLPRLSGANRLKPATSAQVLAESPAKDPLLIAQQYGAGRVLAFAGDSTRLWWQFGKQAEHKRFWRQVVLWLARRDGVEKNEVWVRLPRRRFQLGESPEFTAGVRTASGEVITDADIQVQLVAEPQPPQDLPVNATGEEYQGVIDTLQQPGEFSIQVTARRGGQVLGTAQAGLVVLDRDLELTESAADPGQVQRLAAETAAAGGRLIAAEEFGPLLQQIAENPPEVSLKFQTRWQLGGSWWDAWLFFLVLAVLLIGEWALRKKWGLV